MDPIEVISQRDHPTAYSHFLKTELGCLVGGGEDVLGQFAICAGWASHRCDRRRFAHYQFGFHGNFRRDGEITLLQAEPAVARPRMTPVLPVDYWTNENDFLKTISTHKPFQFVSPDGATFLPASEDFVTGKLYYGTKLNDELRALGTAPAAEGHSFYVSNESEEKTYRHSRSGRHHLQLAALCVTGWRGLGARVQTGGMADKTDREDS